MTPQALFDDAVVLLQSGRLIEAERVCKQLLTAYPGLFQAQYLGGILAVQQGRPVDALAHYDSALALKPDHAEALFHRGNVLLALSRFPEAIASYDRALDVRSDIASIWKNKATALHHTGDATGARESLGRALTLNPRDTQALLHRAVLTGLDMGDYAAAIFDLDAALALDPTLPDAHGMLLRMRLQVCDWRDYALLTARAIQDVRENKASVDPLLFHSISQNSAELRAAAAACGNATFPAKPAMWRARPAHDKIRLGYLSGDLREHATAHLIAGLFECHDRARFEVVAIDNTKTDDSAMRQRLVAAFDQIIPIRGVADDAAARMVADAGIDILINLNGYAGDQRMGVSAWRPAPLQVNYLGFPGTLGVDYIDYILADSVMAPAEDASFYAEKLVTLPHSYQINDAKRAVPSALPSRAESGLPESGFVFCNFNNGHKFTPVFFAAWMRILKEVEGSVLWLLESNAAMRENLQRAAAAQGIAPERLVFAPALPAAEHLARLALADLSLDSLPYNAHTTGSDALWAGVPLVTCKGTAFAGRVGASLLQAIGLPELVTHNLEDYEALAVALARDSARLVALRSKLVDNRASAPLFDTARTCRAIETAYQTMWERHAGGEAPRAFAVPE